MLVTRLLGSRVKKTTEIQSYYPATATTTSYKLGISESLNTQIFFRLPFLSQEEGRVEVVAVFLIPLICQESSWESNGYCKELQHFASNIFCSDQNAFGHLFTKIHTRSRVSRFRETHTRPLRVWRSFAESFSLTTVLVKDTRLCIGLEAPIFGQYKL